MPSIILYPIILGAVVGVLVLLGLLLLCRSCKSQSQSEQDIEDNRHQQKHQSQSGNDKVSQVQKITLRQLNTQLISERARPPTRRPGQRGHEGSFLHKAAIMKHIHPYCNSSIEAILISTERDRKYETEVNLVFKIHPNEFIEAGDYRETVRKCTRFGCFLILKMFCKGLQIKVPLSVLGM